jgi:ubiquitin-conjugating enzyme E2 G1
MASSSQATGAARMLQKQLNEMRKSKDLSGVSVGLVNDNNVFVWQVGIMINDDCKYYGGMFFCSSLSLTLRIHVSARARKREP